MKAWIVTGISGTLLLNALLFGSSRFIEGAIAAQPTSLTRQGNEFLQKGWVDAAITAFEAALKAEPDSLEATIGIAQSYEKAGQLQKAWESYQRVLKIDAENLVALQAIGMMGEYRPEWQLDGIQAITKLISKSDSSSNLKIKLLTQRALLLGFQGKFDQAWADYELILHTEISVQTALKAAQAAGFSGRAAQAIELYDRILQKVPDNSEAQLNRAYFGLEAQRVSVQEAEQVLNAWLQSNADEMPPELFNLVGALPADSKRQGLYDRLLAQVPNNLPVQRRALQLLAIQSPESARFQLAKLMAANAQQPVAYFVQAEVARTLKDLDLAAKSYELLLLQQPDRADALMALGGVRFEQQRYQEAETLLNRALSLSPDSWEIQRILADLHWTQDRPSMALKLLQQVEQAQRQQGIIDRAVGARIAQIELGNLKRRSFQPRWERY